MMRRQIHVIFLAAILALNITGCSMLKFARPKAAPSSAASALVARMPAASSAEGDKLYAELVKLGPAQIEALCLALAPWSGTDEKVEYALSGVTTYAARPGADAERKMVSGALLKALGETKDKEVQAFVIRMLERVGKDEAVAPLGRLLTDEKLCAPAVKVLLTMNTPKATAVLTRALPSAQSTSQRITIIQALGSARVTKATGQIMKFAASADPAVRLEAWYALANLGEPKAEPILAEAAREAAPQERAKASSYYLLFARRQAEAGQPEACARICRTLLQESSTLENRQLQCSALTILAETQGDKAGADLLWAAGSENIQLRATALRLAVKRPGPEVTSQWVAKLGQTQAPATRLDILHMLGERGDRAALPAIVAAFRDQDAGVRQAAITAAGKLGGPEAPKALVSLLQSATEPGDLDAAKAQLLQLPVKDYQGALAAAYPQASPQGRIRMLEIIGTRRMTEEKVLCFTAAGDADGKVRLAALKAMRDVATEQDLGVGINLLLAAKSPAEQTAASNTVDGILERSQDRAAATALVQGAYARVPKAQKAALLEIMPSLSSPGALQTVRKEARSADPATREAAIRALADWSDAAPMDDLLTLSKSSTNAKIRILAYRGYVRMIGTRQGLSDKEKVELCRKAMAAAPSREEAKPVLATLGTIPSPEAFRIAAASLDDPALREEAALAAIAIAGKIGSQIPNEVRPAMKKVMASVSSQATRRKAQGVLNTLDGKTPTARPRRNNRAAAK